VSILAVKCSIHTPYNQVKLCYVNLNTIIIISNVKQNFI